MKLTTNATFSWITVYKMYENTINEILCTDTVTKNYFIGTFAFDELPTITKYPSCLVFNTEPRNKSGEHWLAIYFNSNKNSYFFDSYGQSPSFYKIDKYLQQNSAQVYYNKIKIQGLLPYCGFYCIFFLIFIVRNKLENFYKPFGKLSLNNDYFIYKNINN